MSSQAPEKKESRLARTDRIAREFIEIERRAEERKTARLRALRLKKEEMTA
ncbi:hypothetical protein [Aquibaculum arenosum]|uniref:Uncharacterized protein n=1 Tax=Aquibaculum arenosum TaxID=3032591 RepID=A0ABT5YKK8_9PROT|nr:hypothetical protein [Fodinicurvata sp. CAU 1616]MDF2095320.1 hypothetical protein [Fodinicurvata sp. CAU 1616]